MAAATPPSTPQHLPPPPNNLWSAVDQPIKTEPAEVFEEKPPTIDNSFQDMNKKEQVEKFRKYEAEYASYLRGKYFSDKDIYGGDLFEQRTAVDGKSVKISWLPVTKSYAGPVSCQDESGNSSGSSSDSEMGTPTNILNGNQSTKKTGGTGTSSSINGVIINSL